MTSTEISARDFDYISGLVRENIGVAVAPGKEYLVTARLTPIAHREGLSSVAELIARIRDGDRRLRDDAVDEMATKETYFFRDVHPFEALRTKVLPDLVQRAGHRPLAIWSAAAATGQEAYSLAMLAAEYLPSAPRPQIVATDVSRHALDRASAGTYRQLEINRGLPTSLLVKYFSQDGRNWTVCEDLRQMIRFQKLNLIESFPAMQQQDLILLRNVLTYFEIPTRVRVLNQVARVLHPGGFLLLGATESTYGLTEELEMVHVDKTVMYRHRES